METQSVDLIMRALDALTLRASVTAENIANVGSPGYRPMRVNFEDALAAAAQRGPDALVAFTPEITPDDRRDVSDEMRMDLEVAEAAGTTGRYSALIEILSRQMQLKGLAASWNR